MILFTVGWHSGTAGTGGTGPGHNNTGTADQAETPGPASSDGETVGLAGGEAESHQVDTETAEERRDSFVGVTNGIIEEDDINSNDIIEVQMDIEGDAEDISGSLHPGHGREAVGVTDGEEAALMAEEQAPPRARWIRTRGHVPRGWSCIPAELRCHRCMMADIRRRERDQHHLLFRETALTREFLEIFDDLEVFEF